MNDIVPLHGQIENYSSKTLWVVDNDRGRFIAHPLPPGRRSPGGLDIDGFKAVDGTSIAGHLNWWKLRDFNTVRVRDEGDELAIDCWFCSPVQEEEFGHIHYDNPEDWGEPLEELETQ